VNPLAACIVRWATDPVAMVRDLWRIEPDWWQREALEALASDDPKDRRIVLQACAGPGKTALLAWAAIWFLLCRLRPGEHLKAAATSINGDNLRDNLWAEIALWHGKSPILQGIFNLNAEKYFRRDQPENHFISARTYSKTANLEEQGRTLSGLHAPSILYLIDEAGDMAPAVLKSAEQGLSNCSWGKILMAGNPTSSDGVLYQVVTSQRHLWRHIAITGDPDDPRRSPRIGLEWAREMISLYGRDDAWVMAYILGKFPPVNFNQLLGPDEVREAMERFVPEESYSFAQRRLGVDVARFGDDSTVIFPRQGLVAFKPVVMRGADTLEIASRVSSIRTAWGSEAELVDDSGGYGAGVIDALRQSGSPPIPVNFASKARDLRYFNRRSEMWFLLRDWVRAGGALPKDDQLLRELTAPTYTFHGGKFRLEEKDKIKSRLGSSPDRADALALTFGIPDSPSSTRGRILQHLGEPGRSVTEWEIPS
jgi:hypothetical protein